VTYLIGTLAGTHTTTSSNPQEPTPKNVA
jgi:hypothetical protein